MKRISKQFLAGYTLGLKRGNMNTHEEFVAAWNGYIEDVNAANTRVAQMLEVSHSRADHELAESLASNAVSIEQLDSAMQAKEKSATLADRKTRRSLKRQAKLWKKQQSA